MGPIHDVWTIGRVYSTTRKSLQFEKVSINKYFIFSGNVHEYVWIVKGLFYQMAEKCLTIFHAWVGRGHFCDRDPNPVLTRSGIIVLAGYQQS